MSESFIAIFDSGLGGLTILREVMRILPSENLLYFRRHGARSLWGRSPKTIVRYAMENIRFLMQRRIKCLVIACHTVSAYALPDLQREFSLPILGVIEPAVEEVLKNKSARHILILATSATIASNIYPKLILEKRPHMKITSIAAPLFVPLVEEGVIAHPATDLIVKEYLRAVEGQKIDAALLGCTHYPLIKEAIQKGLGPGVSLIEAGPLTAKSLFDLLDARGLLSPSKKRKLSFIVTDHREKFCRMASSFLGQAIDPKDVEEVDVTSL